MTLSGKVCTVHHLSNLLEWGNHNIETEMTRQGKHVQQELNRWDNERKWLGKWHMKLVDKCFAVTQKRRNNKNLIPTAFLLWICYIPTQETLVSLLLIQNTRSETSVCCLFLFSSVEMTMGTKRNTNQQMPSENIDWIRCSMFSSSVFSSKISTCILSILSSFIFETANPTLQLSFSRFKSVSKHDIIRKPLCKSICTLLSFYCFFRLL